MIHIIIGAVTTALLIRLIQFTKKRNFVLRWWQWTLVAVEYAYVIFVLEIIAGFVEEGAVKGVLVMGTILGFVALIAGFLLARLIFLRKAA